jgi:hypothetical protein
MFTFQAEIPAEHVKELLKKGIEQEIGTKVHSVQFNFKTVTTGYGARERDERVFDGITVHFVDGKV